MVTYCVAKIKETDFFYFFFLITLNILNLVIFFLFIFFFKFLNFWQKLRLITVPVLIHRLLKL